MLTSEENELLTRTGPGAPMGEVLRRYWQPVALAEEMPVGGDPRPVRLLGEDLVLFRDDHDRLGLLGLHCSHRGTDLSYGRVEDGGLRCLYHGWLFDIHGQCLEQPGEPAGCDFRKKIRHTAYPCAEVSGFILTYMGPGEPPLIPNYEIFAAPDSHKHTLKYFQDCNYLQGCEGNFDPVHTSFVHRMLDAEILRKRREGTIKGTDSRMDQLYAQDVAPTLEVEETDFGVRIYAIRSIGPNKQLVRISNHVMPCISIFPGATADDGHSLLWHVPIDDEHHWKVGINYRRSAPLQDKERLRQSITSELTDDYRMLRNRGNRYRQNREEMKDQTFAGLGRSFGVHDAAVIETAGVIRDRTREHLGNADKAIIQMRRRLMHALEQVRQGNDPPHVIRQRNANEFPHLVVRCEAIDKDSEDWRTFWQTAR